MVGSRGGPVRERKGIWASTANRLAIAIPVPDANLLWRNLHVRDVRRTNGRRETRNIRVDVIVDGVTAGKARSGGFEFDYANEESFYRRPLRLSENKSPQRMPVPPEAADTRFAFLPPMSGLAATEPRWESGRINAEPVAPLSSPAAQSRNRWSRRYTKLPSPPQPVIP